MRKYGFIVSGLLAFAVLAVAATEALARCPPGTSYQCVQGFNGKVICGCR